MNFIKKHKAALAITFVCLILIFLASLAVYRMFYPSGDKSVYGDRLQNAPEIDNTVISQIEEEIKNTQLVNSVDYKTNVTIMKFFIDVKSDTEVEEAKQLSDIIMNKLSNKVINFFDIEIYLTQKDGSNSSYPSIGYHSKDAEDFSWVINKVGETSEE